MRHQNSKSAEAAPESADKGGHAGLVLPRSLQDATTSAGPHTPSRTAKSPSRPVSISKPAYTATHTPPKTRAIISAGPRTHTPPETHKSQVGKSPSRHVSIRKPANAATHTPPKTRAVTSAGPHTHTPPEVKSPGRPSRQVAISKPVYAATHTTPPRIHHRRHVIAQTPSRRVAKSPSALKMSPKGRSCHIPIPKEDRFCLKLSAGENKLGLSSASTTSVSWLS